MGVTRFFVRFNLRSTPPSCKMHSVDPPDVGTSRDDGSVCVDRFMDNFVSDLRGDSAD